MRTARVPSIASSDVAAEARRQQALLDALFAPTDDAMFSGAAFAGLAQRGADAIEGLAAYRRNAAAVAARALGAAFPTVEAMIGADDFAVLAREHWQAEPPERGDLGEWGGRFASMLEQHPRLLAYPYLGDCARLDAAVHRCERAADAAFDAGSLTRLQGGDPARLHLQLMPGTALLRSPWPIVTIHRAHHDAEPALEAARVAIAERRAECALVVRAGWRARVQCVDAIAAQWVEQLLAGRAIGPALETAAEEFDFAAWLAQALEGSWLHRVTESPPRGPLA